MYFHPVSGVMVNISDMSFRLQGRFGTRDELRSMIHTCRSLGVRIYNDAVNNHVVGQGNDAQEHRNSPGGGSCVYWPMKNTTADFPPAYNGKKNGSSPIYTQSWTYETNPNSGLPPMNEAPSIGFGPEDFHCNRVLDSWTSPLDLNCGYLVGLTDVDTERDNVRERIADYWTDLLSIGFSGFRIDAAKHMRPPDLAAIFGKLKRNMGGALPDDFITYLEVLTGGEGSLLISNPSSPYSYSAGLENDLKSAGLTMTDINKIKIWGAWWPNDPSLPADGGSWVLSRERTTAQMDDFDQQTSGSTSRDCHGKCVVLVKNPSSSSCDAHRNFEKELFNNPPGASDNDNQFPIRIILSSFWLPSGKCSMNPYGFPDGKSKCEYMTVDRHTCNTCKDLDYISLYQKGSKGYTGCSTNNFTYGEFTRVHRDLEVTNAMRNWMKLPPATEEIQDL